MTVAVVDGNPGTRRGVVRWLGQTPGISVVGEAGDAGEAVRVVGDRHPEVVVIDLRRIASDGMEFLNRLAVAAPESRILLLTAYLTEQERADLTRAGARAILLKEIDSGALVRAIRAVARGAATRERRLEA
ncbi:MAG: response regulator transcription factor [Candidatus Rokubacteria bacterium]|nr:response regulator transcription factor [Candidatus Rokubacteria bacterium]